MSAGRQSRAARPFPCPFCGVGTIRPYRYAVDREPGRDGIRHRWLISQCDSCNGGSFDWADDDPPPARKLERKRHLKLVLPTPGRRDGSQLRYLRSIPSAVYVPMLTGREVHRGGMVRCPWHANGEERTPSLHVREDVGDWFCHPCGIGGGILEFCCELWDRPMPAGGREFARLIDEVDDALRRAT